MSATEDGVRTIITELLGLAPALVTADAALADLGLKNLDRAEMMLEIETDFAILVCWADLREAVTVGDVVAHVDRRLVESGDFRVRASA